LPERPEDDIDLPFKLPKMLQDLKIPFCLDNSGDMEAMGTRNLPFYAGTAVAYGLDYEAAVASISLNSAKMLGIDHRTGSIEKDKDANFFISSGDALDMRTNNVEHAFLLGQAVDLDNKQKQLYRKYAKEYNLDIQE
jgi:imidazolonepropionase-like amidohydrolase